MKKFISYMLIFVLVLGMLVPHQCVCAAEEDDGIFDYVLDFMYKVAELHGIVINTINGNTDDALYEFFVHFLDGNYGLDEFLNDRVKLGQDGSMTVSEDLYNLLMQFIDENATQKVNISDYIYKYYPDKEISTSRVPVANSSYDYIMNKTGAEGRKVVDELIKHKYYWMAFMPADKTTNNSGQNVYAPFYSYIPTEYENNVVFIRCLYGYSNNYTSMAPYVYNKEYQTFTNVPVGNVIYPFNRKNGTVIAGDVELNKYTYADVIYPQTGLLMTLSDSYYNEYINAGGYAMYYGGSSTNFNTTGTPFNYYGTLRFPIWVSQEKYVEYMTLFPNYNPETYITNNEDNSVTINNFYYPESGGDDNPPTDYTGILEEILREVSAFRVTFNLFIDSLNTKIQQQISELQKIYDRQWTLYEMLEMIYNKIQPGGGSSPNLEEIIKYLKSIDSKLSAEMDGWLFEFLNGDGDMTTLKAAFSSALRSRFPFSIVYDFKSLVELLEAEPVKPVFQIPFKMEKLGIDYTFTIDLTAFDKVTSVLQWFLVFMYIYGLLLLTPKFLHVGGDG